MDREDSCESFDLLLQSLHQVLLHEETPLFLEQGTVALVLVALFYCRATFRFRKAIARTVDDP
jgi:hypothetical protein